MICPPPQDRPQGRCQPQEAYVLPGFQPGLNPTRSMSLDTSLQIVKTSTPFVGTCGDDCPYNCYQTQQGQPTPPVRQDTIPLCPQIDRKPQGYLWKLKSERIRKFLETCMVATNDLSKRKYLTANKRYFTVDFDQQLLYYSTSPNSKRISVPMSFCQIEGVREVEVLNGGAFDEEVAKTPTVFGFQVLLCTRSLNLLVKSREEANRWVEIFHLASSLTTGGVLAAPPERAVRLHSKSLIESRRGTCNNGNCYFHSSLDAESAKYCCAPSQPTTNNSTRNGFLFQQSHLPAGAPQMLATSCLRLKSGAVQTKALHSSFVKSHRALQCNEQSPRETENMYQPTTNCLRSRPPFNLRPMEKTGTPSPFRASLRHSCGTFDYRNGDTLNRQQEGDDVSPNIATSPSRPLGTIPKYPLNGGCLTATIKEPVCSSTDNPLPKPRTRQGAEEADECQDEY